MYIRHGVCIYTSALASEFVFLVYREVGYIRGFTRETLSALLVNIESREWRRQFNAENGIPPEHPWASTTDDVECFFSVLRDMVGRDFTHKEVCPWILWSNVPLIICSSCNFD